MFCICSWASLLSGWNKQLSTAITDQFVRVKSPTNPRLHLHLLPQHTAWVNKRRLGLDEEWQAAGAPKVGWREAGPVCLNLKLGLRLIPCIRQRQNASVLHFVNYHQVFESVETFVLVHVHLT